MEPNSNTLKENKYGSLNIVELKRLLKERGARMTGRKTELVDRLIYYDRNNNFGHEPAVKSDARIETPPVLEYKDINATSELPMFTDRHLDVFLKCYDVPIEKGQKLYENGFLQFIRMCKKDNKFFIKSSCKAELKKHMKYNGDIKISADGEIELSWCDCPVGQSTNAHCKHIITALIAVEKWKNEKFAILETTCTERLQTFHKPTKRYSGSPVKSSVFKKRIIPSYKRKLNELCELEFTDHFKTFYPDYFKNIITASAANKMTIKQILKPANTYAVEWDHGFYTKETNEHKILKSLGLIELSEDEAAEIENATRNQSDSKAWRKERSVRLTASMFHSCCLKIDNEEGAKSIVEKILSPKKFSSKSTEHGKIYEDVAVVKFNELHYNALDIQECGLFVPIDRPYLGATPDRLLAQLSIIEVKCPYTIRHTVIHEKTVPYLLRNENGDLELKKNHPYYYQIQGQLYATKRDFCDFIIYTFIDIKVINVIRDDAFISTMLSQLDLFYERYLKPAILEKYLYKNYGSIFFNT